MMTSQRYLNSTWWWSDVKKCYLIWADLVLNDKKKTWNKFLISQNRSSQKSDYTLDSLKINWTYYKLSYIILDPYHCEANIVWHAQKPFKAFGNQSKFKFLCHRVSNIERTIVQRKSMSGVTYISRVSKKSMSQSQIVSVFWWDLEGSSV